MNVRYRIGMVLATHTIQGPRAPDSRFRSVCVIDWQGQAHRKWAELVRGDAIMYLN